MSMIYPKEWVSNLDEKSLQQNAVDIRVNKVVRINSSTPFVLTEDIRRHKGFQEIVPTTIRTYDENHKVVTITDAWDLSPGAYQLECNDVKMPPGTAGTVIMRSSLNRNGVFITSGLYDSGFEGIINCTLQIPYGNFILQRGTRVAQFIMFEAETHSLYNGVYKNRNSHIG